MNAILVPITRRRPQPGAQALLRRSLPPRGGPNRLESLLLAVTGIVVFVDIELGLAYLLHFASRLID
jgi:hypothetical protein